MSTAAPGFLPLRLIGDRARGCTASRPGRPVRVAWRQAEAIAAMVGAVALHHSVSVTHALKDTMIHNHVLRSIRYMLDLSDQKVVDICQLAAPGFAIDKAAAKAMTRKEGEEGFVECSDAVLAHFLDGLVVYRRGRDDSRAPRPVEKHVSNNVVLKKLRVAFELKDADMHEIFEASGYEVTKPELSAFFRDRSHKHYRLCGDQLLRNFLRGLTMRLRPETAGL
jgi:uncharacterized protein YehS (DUF1456 family)